MMRHFGMFAAVTAAAWCFSTERVDAATCSVTNVQYSYACIGDLPVSGSPVASDLATLDGGLWNLVGKEDDTESSAAFDISLNAIEGAYTIFSPLAGYDYALSLKGGTSFSAYAISAATIAANLAGGDLSGFFNMFGVSNPGGNTPGLSNAVLFNRIAETPPEVVPLPAAGWLLLAGVGGLAAIRRRKKAA